MHNEAVNNANANPGVSPPVSLYWDSYSYVIPSYAITCTKHTYHTIIQSDYYYLSGVFVTVWRKQMRLRPDKSDIEDAMLTDQTQLDGVP